VPEQTSDHVLAFQDVWPTLCELLEIAARPAQGEGVSFAPTLLGRGEQKEHEALYFEFRSAQAQALRMGRFKALGKGIGTEQEAWELFDLEQDPQETRDLAGAEPEVLARLRERMIAARTPSETFPFPGLDE
jgi:arylsulfatase A-like enzyme